MLVGLIAYERRGDNNINNIIPDDVQRKVSTVEIIPSEKIWFFDQQTLLQIPLVHSYEGIEDVEKVTDVIENHPGGVEHVVQLPEDHPARHTDQVVEDGHVDDAQPLRREEV